MRTTRQQLLDLWLCITELANTTWDKEFNLALVEVKMAIKSAVEEILERENERFPKAYKSEYEPRRIEICMEHAQKNAHTGEPLQSHGTFVIGDRELFDRKIKKLDKKYKAVVDEYTKAKAEWEDYAKGRADGPTMTTVQDHIKVGILPAGLTPRHLELLWPVLDRDTPPEMPAKDDSESAD